MKELTGRGRLVLEIVFSGGKDSCPSWKIRTGPAMSFSRCSPRSLTCGVDQPGGRLGQQDLAARAARCDSRAEIHVHPNVTVLGEQRPAGVQPHANRNRQAVQRLSGRSDRTGGVCEDGEEGVALRVDLNAVV